MVPDQQEDGSVILRVPREAVGMLDADTRRQIKAAPYQFNVMAEARPEIQPNLLSWLSPFRGTDGHIWPLKRHDYYEQFPALRKAAKVGGIHDGFRHSFASHHLAKFADLGRTTGDLRHRTTAMLFEHYRSAVTRAQGTTYFDIFPGAKYFRHLHPAASSRP